jgi:signal transduction histidine kinase
MRAKPGLRRRLGRAFAFQAVAISVTAIVGVWVAGFTIERILIKRALEQEAAYFWTLREANPQIRAPNTRNLTGYLAQSGDERNFPLALRKLPLGYQRLSTSADVTVAFVTERGSHRLVLVFDGEQVRELAVLFGLLPLGLVLTVLYVAAWLSHRAAQRAVSPIEWLAREVNHLDPERPDADIFSSERLPGHPDTEVADLADALAMLARRVNELLERERTFTRDASHELRSPLTVIRLAADMLLSEQELDRPARNSVLRIKRATRDMQELTEAFLLLSRESEQGLSIQTVSVNSVLAGEIDRAQLLVGARDLRVVMVQDCNLEIEASDRVLSVMIGNLLRNAVNFTDEGEVVARVGQGYVEISDSGTGISREEVDKVFDAFFRGDMTFSTNAAKAPPKSPQRPRDGHGVGLTIVKRFSDRFGWPVRIDSTPGVGTRVVLEFPHARASDLPNM